MRAEDFEPCEELTDTLLENEELAEKNERLKNSIASNGSELNRLISFRSKVYLEKFEQMSQSKALGDELSYRQEFWRDSISFRNQVKNGEDDFYADSVVKIRTISEEIENAENFCAEAEKSIRKWV